jgi:hypothetical protein
MKTFLFLQKNGSAIITLSAENIDGANQELAEIVKDPSEFQCEDEDGEDEDGAINSFLENADMPQ